jgi:hypothetical protein
MRHHRRSGFDHHRLAGEDSKGCPPLCDAGKVAKPCAFGRWQIASF